MAAPGLRRHIGTAPPKKGTTGRNNRTCGTAKVANVDETGSANFVRMPSPSSIAVKPEKCQSSP